MMTERTKDTFIVGRMIIAAKKVREGGIIINMFFDKSFIREMSESHNKSIKKPTKRLKVQKQLCQPINLIF